MQIHFFYRLDFLWLHPFFTGKYREEKDKLLVQRVKWRDSMYFRKTQTDFCFHFCLLFQPSNLLQIPPPFVDISHAEWVSEPTLFRA